MMNENSGLKRKKEELFLCKYCSNGKVKRKLRLYQINLEEAIYLCSNKQCLYPLKDENVMDFIIKRNNFEIIVTNKVMKKQTSKKIKTSDTNDAFSSQLPQKNNHHSEQNISSLDFDIFNDNINFSVTLFNNSSNSSDIDKNSNAPVEEMSNTLRQKHNDINVDNIWNEILLENSPLNENTICNISELDTLKNEDNIISFDDLINDCEITYKDCISWPNNEFNNSSNNLALVYDKALSSDSVTSLNSKNFLSTEVYYPLWKNEDSLCWLNSTLCLLVHNGALQRFMDNLNGGCDSNIKRLFKVYKEVVYLVNNNENSNNTEISVLMNNIRDKMFSFLQANMKCEKGVDDSPVFALPLILREIDIINEMFIIDYRWEMTCTVCGKEEINRKQKILPTFPSTAEDLSLLNAYFVKSCNFCKASSQKSFMKFDRLPECVMIHFMEGLPNRDVNIYDFVFSNNTYKITSFIQYQANPPHFVTWIRNLKDNAWLNCDDLLQPNTAKFNKNEPILKSSEIHIVVWEKQNIQKLDSFNSVRNVGKFSNNSLLINNDDNMSLFSNGNLLMKNRINMSSVNNSVYMDNSNDKVSVNNNKLIISDDKMSSICNDNLLMNNDNDMLAQFEVKVV